MAQNLRKQVLKINDEGQDPSLNQNSAVYE